ncbi:TPA: hypothetical protein I7730_00625 [Vibrio vulnificus]|uniref:Uncharacterized protein n=1 Tax=Vibrio vulnificus TaxID=672 RepID=A0A8H9MYA6_VIBVL|nr:hypothetical protein [Vibrio vulnificus]HAS8538303.1 hypothetical protein [Vibrio vulnificus]
MPNESPVLVVNNPYQIALNKLEGTVEQVSAKLSEHRSFCEVATNYEKRKDAFTGYLAKFQEIIDSVYTGDLPPKEQEIQLAEVRQNQKRLMDFENFCSIAAREKEFALESQIEVLNVAICELQKSAKEWYSHHEKLNIDSEILGFRYEQSPNQI